MLVNVNEENDKEIAVPRARNARTGGKKMESFVIAGKAKTVFRIIELKAKREELARRAKKQASKK